MNFNICLLIIGALDRSGQISLNSMQVLPGRRICIAANSAGKEWLKEVANSNLVNQFCFHDGIVERFPLLDLSEKGNYSLYRSTDFRKLTLLKWDLLRDSILKHIDSEIVLFSDLDILWLKDPMEEIKKLLNTTTSMVVQSDSSQERPGWSCTGIMAWMSTEKNILEIENLRNLQLSQIKSGYFQDDEDTFNQYTGRPVVSLKFSRLPKEGFVVGKDFLKLVLKRQGFNLRTTFCFHANYLTGLNRKSESLHAVESLIKGTALPVKEMVRFVMLPKIRRVTSKLRR